jgi:hypothetical protein
MNRNRVAAVAATGAVLVVLILGFRFLGSPASQRIAREDQQDVWALYLLAGELNTRWGAGSHALPENLDRITALNTKKTSVNGKPFVYHRKDDSHYELCSTLATDNRQLPNTNMSDAWIHPKGDYCFSFDASQPVPQAPYVPY